MTGIRTTAVATLTTAALLLTGTTPAHAAPYRGGDPTGDGEYLDIGAFTILNRERAVLTAVYFDRVRRGRLIVAIDVQHKHKGGYAVVTKYRGRDKEPTGFVVDRNWPARDRRVIRCPKLSVTWHRVADNVSLRIPDNCLGGDQGDISLSYLTERRAADDDWAPQKANGEIDYTSWIDEG